MSILSEEIKINGEGRTECCGETVLEWSEEDQKIMEALESINITISKSIAAAKAAKG